MATVAFAVWNVTRRSPADVVLAAVRAAERGTIFEGAMRFLLGVALLAASIGAVIDAVPVRQLPSYGIVQVLALVGALLADALIGEDLRRLLRLP
ncbi:MAG: hypothetical protein JOZ38_09665 [Candidatus Eremiobacteraeota bacterium]|nr:hypothetical protein [Candidatus Eremiobacteraeota bacterium]